VLLHFTIYTCLLNRVIAADRSGEDGLRGQSTIADSSGGDPNYSSALDIEAQSEHSDSKCRDNLNQFSLVNEHDTSLSHHLRSLCKR
jgi:hypothetical protein